MGPLGTAMRVRVLHAKLYAYALPGSTARQLFISSTLLDSSTARQLLDRPRQTSTKLDAPAHGVSLDRLDKARQARPRQQARQRLDGASTARQLDSQGSTGRVARFSYKPLSWCSSSQVCFACLHGPAKLPPRLFLSPLVCCREFRPTDEESRL